MTDDEKLLFRTHVGTRHPSVVKQKAKLLTRKFALMHEVLPVLENENGKAELEYFSNLYLEAGPILTQIVCFVYENKLADKDVIYRGIDRAQSILGYLKVLHLRYKSIAVLPPVSDNPGWYKYSQLENREIMVKLRELITCWEMEAPLFSRRAFN